MTTLQPDGPKGYTVQAELEIRMRAPARMEGRATRRLAYCCGPHSSVAQASREAEPHQLDITV